MYYLYVFFFYSILGFLSEVLFKFILGFHLHSGVFYGPWCPVYGFGAVIVFLVFPYLDKLKIKKFKRYILMFVTAYVLLSIIEVIGGYAIWYTRGINYWNYSDQALHIGKYFSAVMSLMWGFGSLVAYLWLKKLSDFLYYKINNKIIIFVLCVFVIDVVLGYVIKTLT